MIYDFLTLQTVELVVGIALIVLHGIALMHGEKVRGWLKAFPRSRNMGVGLLTVDGVWAFLLVANMDLGEFSHFRKALMILVPVAWFLSIKFVDEFLAVRALGMLLLLLAEPVLEVAFLRPETGKLLVVPLAYVWTVIGMFWVGMPYLLRDQIAWCIKSPARWQLVCLGGIGYGAAILACRFF
jgi:hypothetical protein